MVPIEELHSQLLFELADLVTDSRLGLLFLLRCAADTAAVHNGHEGLERIQIERLDDLKIRWSPSKIYSFSDQASGLLSRYRSNEIRTLSSRYSALSLVCFVLFVVFLSRAWGCLLLF